MLVPRRRPLRCLCGAAQISRLDGILSRLDGHRAAARNPPALLEPGRRGHLHPRRPTKEGTEMFRRRRMPREAITIRKRKPRTEPSLPGLVRVTSGLQRSDPDYWKDRAEAEAEAKKERFN